MLPTSNVPSLDLTFETRPSRKNLLYTLKSVLLKSVDLGIFAILSSFWVQNTVQRKAIATGCKPVTHASKNV